MATMMIASPKLEPVELAVLVNEELIMAMSSNKSTLSLSILYHLERGTKPGVSNLNVDQSRSKGS
jgi:hypothetical protein